MIEKTGVIGGLDLPDKAKHQKERERNWYYVAGNKLCG